jgi:hypothetical protein
MIRMQIPETPLSPDGAIQYHLTEVNPWAQTDGSYGFRQFSRAAQIVHTRKPQSNSLPPTLHTEE